VTSKNPKAYHPRLLRLPQKKSTETNQIFPSSFVSFEQVCANESDLSSILLPPVDSTNPEVISPVVTIELIDPASGDQIPVEDGDTIQFKVIIFFFLVDPFSSAFEGFIFSLFRDQIPLLPDLQKELRR